MTDKQDGMPEVIWAWRPEILYGEITASSKEHKLPAEPYIRKDKYDKVVEQLDLTGQQMTRLAMALDKAMDENKRLQDLGDT